MQIRKWTDLIIIKYFLTSIIHYYAVFLLAGIKKTSRSSQGNMIDDRLSFQFLFLSKQNTNKPQFSQAFPIQVGEENCYISFHMCANISSVTIFILCFIFGFGAFEPQLLRSDLTFYDIKSTWKLFRCGKTIPGDDHK